MRSPSCDGCEGCEMEFEVDTGRKLRYYGLSCLCTVVYSATWCDATADSGEGGAASGLLWREKLKLNPPCLIVHKQTSETKNT